MISQPMRSGKSLWKCSGVYLEDQYKQSLYVYCLTSQKQSLKTGFSSIMNSSIAIPYIQKDSFHHFICFFVWVTVFITVPVPTFFLSRIIFCSSLLSVCCRSPSRWNYWPVQEPDLKYETHNDVWVQNRCWLVACASAPAHHTHPFTLLVSVFITGTSYV